MLVKVKHGGVLHPIFSITRKKVLKHCHEERQADIEYAEKNSWLAKNDTRGQSYKLFFDRT
jgi:hypothetical protein